MMMTKRIRIEDADQSNWQVVVRVMERGARKLLQSDDGAPTEVAQAPDRVVSETRFFGPTDMKEFHIHGGQYLVVLEDGERK
jgi:hypothetical protein